jgi:hypothetical protein
MAEIDPNLVQAVAEEVIQALIDQGTLAPGQSQAAPPPQASSPGQASNAGSNPAAASLPPALKGQANPRAGLAPPIGVCTGDYAQFPERPDLLAHRRHQSAHGQASAAPNRPTVTRSTNGKPSAGDATPAPPQTNQPTPQNSQPAHDRPLTGFVSARTLADLGQATVTLDPAAKLTPLAQDYVRRRNITIQRQTAGETSPPTLTTPAAEAAGRFLWWIEGACSTVSTLVGERASQLTASDHPTQTAALPNVITALDERVRRGQSPGGILFVRSAAQAGCFANRCCGLRAIVGTCDEAVQQGMDQVAANVLIVEYPYQDAATMRTMIDRFLTGQRRNWAVVNQRLEALRVCV